MCRWKLTGRAAEVLGRRSSAELGESAVDVDVAEIGADVGDPEGHGGEDRPQQRERLLGLPAGLSLARQHRFPFGHVADDDRDQHAVVGGDWAQADLHWELGPVLATGDEVQPGAHRARAWAGAIGRPVSNVCGAQTLRQQQLDRPAEELVRAVPEEPLGLRVGQHDSPSGIDHGDGIRRGIQHRAEQRIGLEAIEQAVSGRPSRCRAMA